MTRSGGGFRGKQSELERGAFVGFAFAEHDMVMLGPARGAGFRLRADHGPIGAGRRDQEQREEESCAKPGHRIFSAAQ